MNHIDTAPVFRLTYVSAATRKIDAAELAALAETAKRENTILGVTGLLVECAGEFLQILEGQREAVLWLYQHIEQDPRHEEATILDIEPVVKRKFNGWAMGCFRLEPQDLPDGFLFDREHGGLKIRRDGLVRAADLLATFYRENRSVGESDSFASLIAA